MKYECLKLEERRIIEEMYAKGAKPGEIAERVGKCQATIYRELERGKTGETDSRFRQGYSAAVAEARVNRSYRNRGRRKRHSKKEVTHTMNGKTLTAEQCSKLSLYILMTTKTREGEAEAWEKLAEEKKEDGSPKYIHAADNAQFWRELDADLRKILRDLEA